MHARIVWSLIALLLVVTAPANAQPTPLVESAAAQAALEPLITTYHTTTSCPGVTIGYALPDGTSGSVSAGLAFTETNTPMTGTHRMMAGSTGKTFFAALILQLVDEGLLELDAPISTWLGEAPWFSRLPNADTITLRMLLNHTSGIPRYVMLPAFTQAMKDDPNRHWDPVELLGFIFETPAHFPAGEGWSYADTNYIVAAMIVEAATGESCYSQMHRRLLRPHALWDIVPTTSRDVLGLAGGYVDPQRNLLSLTEPNVVQGGRYVFNPQFEWAGGGFASTPRDLARWAHLLYGDAVLSADMQRAMRDAVAAQLGPGSRYGLGMMERPSAAGTVLGHAGYFPGYLTDMAYYADHEIALTVQVNTTKMSPQLNPRTMQTLLDECAAALIALDDED